MKKYLIYSMTALLATVAVSIAAPDKAALEAKEKAAWQAFKDKNVDEFKKVVAGDLVAVYPSGMSDMQGELDSMKKSDMKSFSMSDFKVVAEGADMAISTYKVVMEGSMDGKDASGTYNCATVWKKQGGQWHAVFHTDMKAEAPAAK